MYKTVISFFYSLLLSLILFLSAAALFAVSENNSSFPKLASLDRDNGKLILLDSAVELRYADALLYFDAASEILSFNKLLCPEPICRALSFFMTDAANCAGEFLSAFARLFEKVIHQNTSAAPP